MEKNTQTVRLNKYVASLGIASRREADRLVQDGKVLVNGQVELNPAVRVDPVTDKVVVQGHEKELFYIKLNKPKGYVVSTNKDEGIPVYKLIPAGLDVSPIGRLDKDSTGLLLFSNDSTLPAKIIGEKGQCEKEYYVKVKNPIPDAALDKMREGVALWGEKTLPATVERRSDRSFSIILKEGKNRQIRRMCQKVGYPVQELKRLRIHTVKLDGLQSGAWANLTDAEIKALKNLP